MMVWQRHERLAQNTYPQDRDQQEAFELAYVQAYQEGRDLLSSPKRIAKRLSKELSSFTNGVPSRSIGVSNPGFAGRMTGLFFAFADSNVAHKLDEKQRRIFVAFGKKIRGFSAYIDKEIRDVVEEKLAA